MGTFPALAGTPAWERVACRTPPPGHQLGGRQHRKENPHEDHHLDQVTPTPTTTTHRKENPHEDHHLDQVTPTPTTTTHRKENPHEDHHLDQVTPTPTTTTHRKENPHEDHHLDHVTPTPTTTTHRKENPHEDHHLDLSLMCVTGRRRRTAKTEAGADPITSARPVGYERSTAWASTNLIAATAMMPSAPQAAITTAGE